MADLTELIGPRHLKCAWLGRTSRKRASQTEPVRALDTQLPAGAAFEISVTDPRLHFAHSSPVYGCRPALLFACCLGPWRRKVRSDSANAPRTSMQVTISVAGAQRKSEDDIPPKQTQ